MALNTNKREGDKLHAEEWNELVQEVQGKQSRLNIVDALDSDSAVDVLSAKQGKMLKGMIDNATTNVNNVADVVKTLPVGYFYGTFSTEESLPIEITEKGYAYVGTGNPYIIYTFDADLGWTATENKYSTPALETDLSTGSEVKAPTTKAVKEGIESIDVTAQQSFTNSQKKTARTNIGAQENITSMQNVQPVVAALNDRAADVVVATGDVKALGYKVLNPNQSFAEQVTAANTVYEIRDFFDISGTNQEPATVIIPANCKLRFEGGMLGGEYVSLQGNNTIIESDSVCIQKGVKITGTWGNDVIYTKWLEFVSAKDAYLPAAVGTAGVMAPIFEDNTYYKSGRNYVLLTEEPDNWPTNYMDYFQIVDNEYVSVTPVAPTYTKNTYYKKEGDTYTILDGDESPSNWGTNYSDYYTKSGSVYTPVAGVKPDFVEDIFYKDEGVGYEQLLIVPTDWLTNWSSYYVKEGNEYVTPMGIIDNPNATNNINVFKQLEALVNGSTKGCKVEFEKGYYQVKVNASPLGTTTIGGVEYEIWRPTGNQPTNHVVLDIKDIPALVINLNQSHIKALTTTCPDWNIMRIVRLESVSILNGTIEGFANRFGYPNYKPSSSSSLSGDYEFPVLIKAMCKIISINGITAYNSEGDAFMIGSGGATSICESWIVENTEIHHCGRDGISAYSSNNATCINTYIHNIGSDGGHGVIGSDGIKGMDGRTGLNFEFEDTLKLRPVVHLDSMRIETCAKSSISEMSNSPLKTFTATNMYIHGTLNSSYIRTIDGKPTFRDSVFIHEGGANYNIGVIIYDNCFFTLKKALYISENTFRNCRIIDEAPTEYSRQILYYDSGEQAQKGRLENCYVSLKHSAAIFKKEIVGCTIVFEKEGKVIALNGNNFFKDTKFESTIEGTYNNSIVADNTKSTNTFEKCEFINIKGTSDQVHPLNIMTNLVFKDCVAPSLTVYTYGEKTIKFDNFKCDGTLYLPVTSMTSSGLIQILNSNIYRLSKKGSVPLEIKGSRIANVSFFNGTNTIEDSIMNFAPASSDYYPRGTFKNCQLTMTATMNDVSENRVTLENCYIDGAATQAAFKGTATNCVFKNNADSGTSAQRPPYNLVVGQRYYDTTLGKPIYWNGTAWVDNPNVRPGENIPIGFEIYDLELKKPIYWDGYAWRDVNGSYIFDNSGSLQNRLALTSPIKGQQFKLTREGETDVYLIYGDYCWLNATDRSPWFDDSGTLNAMYDKYNYTLLTEKPSNWPTAYNTYYKIVDGVYTKLSTLETWASDTYYKKDENVYTGIQVKLTDDDTELYNKVVKWNGTKYINIIDNVALKVGTPEVAFTTENNTTTATITSTSSGKIYYTKDGNDPTSSSTEYSSAITLADGDQVKAICIRDHMDNSNICFVPVAKPVITFNDGILHIECDTPDAKIYYTTDGNRPSTSSTVYDSSASVTIATGITVKAFATLIGRVNSGVTTKKRS